VSGRGPVLLLLLALALPAVAADLRRVESVGVVPIEDRGRRETDRQRAVAAALARAVERVAERALEQAPPEPAPGEQRRPAPDAIAPALAPALGDDPFEYATRFRILEERGIRPAMLSGSDAEQEYVVLVEVFVDATRIGERLAAAGWREDPAGSHSRVHLVLEGLRSFQAYDALRRALSDELHVRSVIPVELVRGRAVLEVDSDYDPDGLLAALADTAEPGLRVVPVSRDADTLTVLVDWTPPPVPAGGSDAYPGSGRR
jgi:hypothetical protein